MRSSRFTRGVATGVSAALVAAAVSAAGFPSAAGPVKPPAVPRVPRAAATPYVSHAVPPKPQAPGRPRAGTVWPAVADADVDLGAAPAARARASGQTSAAAANAVPLTLHAKGAAAGSAHVHVWDQKSAAAAGVSGVAFTVTSSTGSGPSTATAGVDYAGFANAGGADFGYRLRLVQLPACVLTTPELAACRTQTPVAGSHNDTATSTLAADVTLPSAAGTAVSAASAAQAADTRAKGLSPSMMVLAAVGGSSGSTGDFTATSLAPSGSWSQGGATGSADWSYPITVPPAAAGAVAPNIALSYSSSSVDGRTATTNNQSSWIGEGWDYSPGYIERTYEPCSTFTDLPSASQTSDECWAGQILTLSLKGVSNALVWDPTTNQVKLQTDDGSRVNRLTGAANGALNGEYWEVTTPDGTMYFFGRNGGPGQTTQPGTSSTWTEPVYGAHSGDPCNSSSGFSSSVCTQAWRWNLDYVEDPHGNAAMYYYTPETNYYGEDNGTTGVKYTRGGYLNKIDYGLRDENGTVYGPATPDQVQFTVSERCIPGSPSGNTCSDTQFTTANGSYWPDVPIDQNCPQGATCNVHAPTFWSRKMLSNITTVYWNGTAYVKVDSYDLGHQFPTDADPESWLSSITRTGYAADGTSIAMPPVITYGAAMPNRVPGYNSQPTMPHWRLSSLVLETGEVVTFSLSTTCSVAAIPSDPSANTGQCLPIYWYPMGGTTPTLDWFNKYVLTKVTEANPSGENPPVSAQKVTQYSYVGSAAWHYDDNEVVKPSQRTWGQWRGYGEVDVKTGDPANSEPLTKTATFYDRGMNGDTLPGGKTRSASVINTLNETHTDDYRYRDEPYETQTFDGDGGAEVSATLTDYTVAATTATRARTGLPSLTSDMVRIARTRSLTDKASGGVRTVTTADSYDGVGRLIAADATGDGVPEVCTTTAYADNTTSWIRDRASETIASQQACPAGGTAQSDILSDTRTFYDQSATLGQVSGAGDVTRTDVENNPNGSAPAFHTASTATYDPSGRVLTSSQAVTPTTNRTTTTAYTPYDIGPLTQKVTTNALSQATTSVVNPDRGTIASVTDVAGHVTSATYDQLGRITQLWKPGRAQGQVGPNQTFTYAMTDTAPEAVTTNTLVDYGSGSDYVTAVTITDALGRSIQTQTATEGGGSQVSGTHYDGHGWTVATDDHYLIAALPSGTVQQTAPTGVDARTVTAFDGAGRPVTATALKNGVVTGVTSTVYGGDRTTVVPPQPGGTVTTTVTDAHGATVELDQYTTAPSVNNGVVSGGVFQPTTYKFDALGRQIQMTSAGATWTSTLDMLGQKYAQTDPDSGAGSTYYNLDGSVQHTTDARGQSLAYDYDALGRKLDEYSGTDATGTKLDAWLYDTLQAGQLTNETRYTPSGNYVTGTSGYDSMGNATSQITTIPAAETGLNKSWVTRYTYSSTGLNLTITPAPVTGLPGETVTNTFDGFGQQTNVHGTSVTASQTLNGYDLPGRITYGGSTNNAWESLTYDLQLLKPVDVNLTAQTATPQVDDTAYHYDDLGQLTRSTDTQGPAGTSPVDDQCFGYDLLGRLTQAWSATDACAGQPNNAATGGNIGGPAPYWTSWTFNNDGTRAQQVRHALPGTTGGDTKTTYGYGTVAPGCAVGSGNPVHGLDTTTTTGPGAATGSYCYDASGNTSARPDTGGGSAGQSLTWDEDGRIKTDAGAAGTTTYVYSADGDQLVRRDPASTTLFLPGEEVTRTSGGVITGVRTYSLGSLVIGEGNGQAAGTVYLIGDAHSTQQIAINIVTLNATRRMFDPYGNARGTVTGGPWPDTHGFLNKPVDADTGLTDIGARKYDPVTGRFVSVDPVLEQTDPQQLSGYTYSADDPVNEADPTGKCLLVCGLDPFGPINNMLGSAAHATANFVGAAGDRVGSFADFEWENAKRDLNPLRAGQTSWDIFTGTMAVEQISGLEATLVEGGHIHDEGPFCGKQEVCITGVSSGKAGMTTGHTVRFDTVDHASDPDMQAHETQHVLDIEHVGADAFYTTYYEDYFEHLMAGESSEQAYRDVWWEKRAYKENDNPDGQDYNYSSGTPTASRPSGVGPGDFLRLLGSLSVHLPDRIGCGYSCSSGDDSTSVGGITTVATQVGAGGAGGHLLAAAF